MGNKRNQSVRKEMQRLYGKGDMFDKAGIEQKIEEKRTIKTYKQFLEEKHYTRKFITMYDKQMTVHHLKHKADGGETSKENCVITSALKQFYIHSLPRQDEEVINNYFREYLREKEKELKEKQGTYKKVKVQKVDDLETGVEVKFTDIELTEEESIEYQKYLEERRKRINKKFKYNPGLDNNIKRKKAHIDEDWQKEIMQDVINELRLE